MKNLSAVALLTLVAGTAIAAPRESLPGPASVNSFPAAVTPESFTLAFTGSDAGGSYTATHVAITGSLTSNAAGDFGSDNSIDIMTPDGATVTALLSPLNGTYTTTPVNVFAIIPGAITTAGTWTFTVYNTYTDGDGASAEAVLTGVTVTLDDAPAATNTSPEGATNLGTLVDGTNVSATGEVPAAGTLWYKFTSPAADAGTGIKLTVSTRNSPGAGDSEIGLYGSDGTLINNNDDNNPGGGNGLLSHMTFGSGGVFGDAPAGEKYVALSSYNATFASGFSVTSTGQGGSFQLDVLSQFVGDPRPTAIDLGTLVDNVTVAQDVTVAPNGVTWLKANVADCSAAAGRSLTLSTLESTNGGDSLIAIYSNDGAGIVYNDDAGGTLLSELVMGRGGFADLAAGTYYFAVTTFPTTFYIAQWNVESTGAGGNFRFTALQQNSFPPEAVAAAQASGNGQLLTVTVTPGVNPDSTGIAVTGNLTELGGAASVAFHDDGLNGDVTAGDNIFSLFVTNPSGGSDGQAYNVAYTVTDQQAHNLTGTIAFSTDSNNALATAEVPAAFDSIAGSFDFANDVDVYKIGICDPSSFTASTVGGTTADTQLFLFDANGMGVSSDDDDPAGSGLQAVLSGQFVTASGNYYLAVSRYNADPVDSSGQLIWANTPFNVERAPDGPGAGNPLAGWVGGSFGTANYTVALTGACAPTAGGQCSPADVGTAGGVAGHDRLLNNNDFIAFITLFFANDPQADLGTSGGVAGSDNAWNNNDFIAFISYFFNDQGSCNG